VFPFQVFRYFEAISEMGNDFYPIVFRKYTLHDLNPFEFIKICCILVNVLCVLEKTVFFCFGVACSVNISQVR
jgi:hypothetical protein